MRCPPGDPLPRSVLKAAADLRGTALLRTWFPQQEAQVPPQFYRLHNSKTQIINSRHKNTAGAEFCQDCCLMFDPGGVEHPSVDKDDKGFYFQTLAD